MLLSLSFVVLRLRRTAATRVELVSCPLFVITSAGGFILYTVFNSAGRRARNGTRFYALLSTIEYLGGRRLNRMNLLVFVLRKLSLNNNNIFGI